MTRLSLMLPAALVYVLASPSTAQEPLALSRLTGPIVLDGVSDEAAWQRVEPLPASAYSTTTTGEPTERTVFRVAYDDDYLYASGEMFDSEPEAIRAVSLGRDATGLTNDWFAIMVDTFNDKENLLFFGTNPAGVRTDGAIREGIGNWSWNTFWDSAVRRNDRGWFAEIRIPLASLRFQETDDQVLMGLTLWRNIARKNEWITFPEISIARGGLFRASSAGEVSLQDLRPSNPVFITPYLLAGAGRSQILNGAETAYTGSDQSVREAGLDLKYAVTSNLTLDLTYNTDFAQVEADDQQLNLTRFSIFFPEKRLFFQERASIFEFSIGENDRLFYSRRIGLAQGQQVPIHGGGRLVGRLGGWDVGVLSMQTASSNDLPSENFAVARLRRRMFNENSYIGGIITSRVGGGDRALLYGLDGIVRVFGDDYVILNWAQSFSDDQAIESGLSRSLLRARWERRGTDGLTYGFEASRSGEAFDPAVGYQLRSNYTRLGDHVTYGWRPGAEARLMRFQLAMRAHGYRDNRDGSLQSARIGPEWYTETRSGHRLRIGADVMREKLDAEFRLSPAAVVPAGRYGFTVGRIEYKAPSANRLRTSVEIEAGSFFDGSQITGRIAPTWNVSRHLEVGGSYQLSRIRFPRRNQEFQPHLVGLRTNLMLSTRVSAAAFIQYSSAADGLYGNVRFRYNPREGDDLYLVYNIGLNTDRFEYSPVRPMLDRHVVMIKYSRTFGFGS